MKNHNKYCSGIYNENSLFLSLSRIRLSACKTINLFCAPDMKMVISIRTSLDHWLSWKQIMTRS